MTPELSPELRRAVHQLRGTQPLRVIDPETQINWVLVRAEVYDQVQSVLRESEEELADTYAAQSEAALRAGWDGPATADYDEARKKLCP